HRLSQGRVEATDRELTPGERERREPDDPGSQSFAPPITHPDAGMHSVFLFVPELTSSGETAGMRMLATGLPPDRVRVAIGALGSIDESIAKELQTAGIATHSVPFRPIFDLGGQNRLKRLVHAAAPAIIHAWGPQATRVARFVVKGEDGVNTPRLIISA